MGVGPAGAAAREAVSCQSSRDKRSKPSLEAGPLQPSSPDSFVSQQQEGRAISEAFEPPEGTQPELTPKQEARRQRVIEAARELATEGGYEAVQMRDVAARAGVALGTVYRYFASKDQLLAAVWADWTAALEQRLRRRPLEGRTMAERVIDFMLRATRPFERRPQLAAALVMSVASPDPRAADYQREIASWMTRIVVETLEGIPDDERQAIREVLGHVWYSVLLAWVKGRMSTEDMRGLLASACHLLLDLREGEGAYPYRGEGGYRRRGD